MSGDALERALAAPRQLTAGDVIACLSCADAGFEASLFAAACAVKAACGRDAVLPRGLVEVSNVCAKDCLYCGIRKGNAAVSRYRLDADVVRACCAEAARRGYPAVAFQGGEIESEANTAFYEARLREIVAEGRLGEVTLSLGEQTEEVLRRWKAAAGGLVLRYLLRIETSNRTLYAKIHPADCSFDRRLACIRALKRLGYVTGSGVMIGLPGQTVEDLARDVVFFADERLDMVGMGPFVPHAETPLGAAAIRAGLDAPDVRAATFRLALRMIAVTRLMLHDVNIVAATALEAMDPDGREKGLAAGANVIMPNLTPADCRARYTLYPGKVAAD